MGKLFGTDGVRGVANRQLTPELALGLGRAHGHLLGAGARVVIGKDTRLSSDMLEAAYAAGLMSSGARPLLAGMLPTPAVAYLVRHLHAQGGAMISASHNPIADNGIKLFEATGFKLDDAGSARIEELLAGEDAMPRPEGEGVGQAESPAGLQAIYEEFLVSLAPCRLDGLHVILDCAHGAACLVAPHVFEQLGARLELLHSEPDGSRINVRCGSTDLSELRAAVLERGAALGLAFDGDADRCLAVDEAGQGVDGDRMLLLFAEWLRGQGRLRGDLVVATVMSNFGLEQALSERDLKLIRAAVGDRYVLEAMQQTGAVLGGEQSGHLIFLEHGTTGDGILSGMMLAAVAKSSGQTVSSLAQRLTPLPQKLVNVRVRSKDELDSDNEIAAAISRQEGRLSNRGRLLIRPSGTEPLVRVMAEGPDEKELDEILAELSGLIAQRLG